jgi:uncharacterized protein YjbI with pentapeptide repeats
MNVGDKKSNGWSWPALRHDLSVGLISGAVVALLSLGAQVYFDDQRSDREALQEDLRSAREARQENLRFVRDRSSEDAVERTFQDIDLSEQNLSGLKLAGADLSGAKLVNAKLHAVDLSNSNLMGADLSGADLRQANLHNAMMYETVLTDAQFDLANLGDADLRLSNAQEANFEAATPRATVCYDGKTQWPDGFTPPIRPDDSLCDPVWAARSR